MSVEAPDNLDLTEPPPLQADPREQVHRDMMFLAGELMHRGAQTQLERRAAEYLRGRFKEHTPDVELEDFHAIENPAYLFGSYFGEFVFVGLLALGWPLFALFYGLGVLASFLAEYHGVRLFGRLLPEYETQNVIARFLAPRPRALIIVTANYDSGAASPLTAPGVLPWLRHALRGLLGCMVIMLATCGAEAWVLYQGGEASPWLYAARWGAIAVLAAAAAFMFYASRNVDDIRGANNNASGVCGLLRLAARLQAEGVASADVWLAATGSHEAWMSGTKQLLTHLKQEKRPVFVLNLEAIGAGTLHYTTAEGLLAPMACGKPLFAAAAACAERYHAAPAALCTVPSGAHLPLAAGHAAMSVLRLGEDGAPVHWNQIADRLTEVDDAAIVEATDFAEAVLRRLAERLPA